jgi:hypothetical protein
MPLEISVTRSREAGGEEGGRGREREGGLGSRREGGRGSRRRERRRGRERRVSWGSILLK